MYCLLKGAPQSSHQHQILTSHALLYQGFTVHSLKSNKGLIHLIFGAKLLFQAVMYFQTWNIRSHQ